MQDQINSNVASRSAKKKIIKCSDRNRTASPAFFSKILTTEPVTPSSAVRAFLAKSNRKFANFLKLFLATVFTLSI